MSNEPDIIRLERELAKARAETESAERNAEINQNESDEELIAMTKDRNRLAEALETAISGIETTFPMGGTQSPLITKLRKALAGGEGK